LPSLLLCGLTLILANASIAAADPAEDAAVAEIRKLGGTVRQISSKNNDLEVGFHFGGAAVTDDALAHLTKLKNLVAVNLKGTKITDAGMAHLKGLTNLRRLHLEQTAIGDAGIAQLAGLVNLEYLNLYGTQVSDASLAHLKNLKKLKRVYLWQTKVTDDGADKLAEAMPELSVIQGANRNHPNSGPRKRVVIDEPALPIAGEPWKVVGIRYEKENPSAKAIAKVHYRTKGSSDFASADLVRTKEGRFEATIPGATTKSPFQYYLVVTEPKQPPATYPSAGAKGPVEVTPDAAPPVLAADPQATDAKSYRVQLAWKAATDDRGIAAYRIYRGKEPSAAADNLLGKVAADKLLYSDDKPPAGETVWYAIEPIDVAGRAGKVRAVKVEVPNDVAPTNELKLTAQAGSKAVVLSWSGAPEPDVTHLLVLRGEGADGKLAQVAELKIAAATRWIDKTVSGKTKYRYVIKLRDAGGHESAASIEAIAQAGSFLRRINCGGAEVVSADGTNWEADNKSVSGSGRFTTKTAVAGVPDGLKGVYTTERWSNSTVRYQFDVSPGRYQVVLHFAETNRIFSVKGKRKFDVFINDKKIHADVDIFANAGAAKAWQLPTELDVSGKQLVIELKKGSNGPAIKGLEVRELVK
jgi:hypothetical protein